MNVTVTTSGCRLITGEGPSIELQGTDPEGMGQGSDRTTDELQSPVVPRLGRTGGGAEIHSRPPLVV